MSGIELDLALRKTALDVPTLFRVLPWVFLMRDTRDVPSLVAAALRDTRDFLDAYVGDPSRDRGTLMRGLAINLFRALGMGDPDPATLNALVALVARAVDDAIDQHFKPEIQGDVA